MIWLGTPSNAEAIDMMRRGDIGLMTTPWGGSHTRIELTKVWAGDTGCFLHPKEYDTTKYLRWLERWADFKDKCLFVTAPDVVGDPVATLDRSLPVLPLIRERGYRSAFVGQDGCEGMEVPWGEFDVLFIGGSTEWKLGPGAAALIRESVSSRGVPVHMGRVNSLKRLMYATELGCTSSDGTKLRFSPDVEIVKVRQWVEALKARAQEFE